MQSCLSQNPFSYICEIIAQLVMYLLSILKTRPGNIQRIFSAVKIENLTSKNFDILNMFAQNIDCGCMLEPPRRGASNEYPQSMFWTKNKKNRCTPAYPSFII